MLEYSAMDIVFMEPRKSLVLGRPTKLSDLAARATQRLLWCSSGCLPQYTLVQHHGVVWYICRLGPSVPS